MRMYKCVECGHLFEEGEEARWEEDRGEFWGVSCSETVSGCPVCHGDYERVYQCKKCEEWHYDDELDDGLCESCQEGEEQ